MDSSDFIIVSAFLSLLMTFIIKVPKLLGKQNGIHFIILVFVQIQYFS